MTSPSVQLIACDHRLCCKVRARALQRTADGNGPAVACLPPISCTARRRTKRIRSILRRPETQFTRQYPSGLRRVKSARVRPSVLVAVVDPLFGAYEKRVGLTFVGDSVRQARVPSTTRRHPSRRN